MKSKAFTIIEVLVVIGMLAVILVSASQFMTTMTTKTFERKTDYQADIYLQDGMEVVYNLLQGDWDSSWTKYDENNTYFPAIIVSTKKWKLDVGIESLESGRYKRKLKFSRVCRDSTTGNWIAATAGAACPAGTVWDNNSKAVKCEVTWKEKGTDRSKETIYLITRTNYI